MRRFFKYTTGLLILLTLLSCSTIKYLPVEHTEYVTVTERETIRDTIVRVELEKARISDFVDISDTLVLQTSLSRSVSFMDTTSRKLRGTIENIRPYVEKPVQVKEREVVRDSIVRVEVPVEVEKPVKYVPKFWRFFGILGILSLAAAVFLLLRKLNLIRV